MHIQTYKMFNMDVFNVIIHPRLLVFSTMWLYLYFMHGSEY